MPNRTTRRRAWWLIAAASLALFSHAAAQEAAPPSPVVGAPPGADSKTGGAPGNTNTGANANNTNAAAATPQPKIVPEPPTVQVAGRRGETKKRRLLLQATEPISVKQIVTNDLQRGDGVVIPADQIQAATEEPAAPDAPRVLLTFDLNGVAAGEFSGNVRVVHAKGVQAVPVSVKVKHHWLPPLLVLLTGLGLGTALTAYRKKGRLRDEVLVRVGQLRAQVRTDAELNSELARPFLEQIRNHLLDVQVALDAEKWADASTAADRAQAVFNNWAKHRPSWLEQLRYHAELKSRLAELKASNAGAASGYLLKVERGLDDAARDAAGADAPKPFRDRLDLIWQQINDYASARARIKELERLTAALPASTPAHEVKAWQAKALALTQRLDGLLPGDAAFATDYKSLVADADSEVAEISKLIPVGARMALAAPFDLPMPPPAVRPAPDERRAAQARERLRLFTWVSYVVALVLLAAAGFGELYVARPTFGATAWGDYFALLAWGFGAEATRASVAQTVKNWGLLGFPNS